MPFPDSKLLIVTGKGGVGKTTVAASLAYLLSHERNVRLIEVDPREGAHGLFGVPPSGGDEVAVSNRLRLLHLRPRQVIDELVRSKLKIGPLVRRIQASPVYDHFVEGCPGLSELAVLRRAYELVGPGSPSSSNDCIVLDSPATGHAISLLSAPSLVAEAIVKGPIATMAAEVSDWLHSGSTGMVMVTLAEELPVTESLEAAVPMEELLGRPPEAWIVNGLYPELPSEPAEPSEPSEPATQSPSGPLARLWSRRRAVNDRELDRLERAVGKPLVTLPLLAIDEGRELVDALAAELGSSFS